MSCALLENSKGQYNAFRTKHQSAYLATHPLTGEHAVRVAIKRPATTKVSSVNEISSKKLFATIPTVSHGIIQAQPSVPVKAPSLPATQPTSTLAQQKTPASVAVAPARRQIFWNTALISTTTKFVLDVQANQAFGFGTDGKERLASKHPELIRYLPDSEDRDWLTAQNIIAQQNRNSRFLFLLHDEVCRLQQSHEAYRTKPNVDLDVMHTFTVPEFMIQKMKLFFVDLNIKSRGLITNSFSVSAANVQSNSHLRNALLQGVQSTANAAVSGGSGPETTASQVAPANNVTTSSDSSVNPGPTSTLLKPKTSALSSSHATLTALLNNSGSTPNEKVAPTKPRK